jgi:hypothetical protein
MWEAPRYAGEVEKQLLTFLTMVLGGRWLPAALPPLNCSSKQLLCDHMMEGHRNSVDILVSRKSFADRLCDLVSEFLATDPEVRVRFPALTYFLRSSGSGTE